MTTDLPGSGWRKILHNQPVSSSGARGLQDTELLFVCLLNCLIYPCWDFGNSVPKMVPCLKLTNLAPSIAAATVPARVPGELNPHSPTVHRLSVKLLRTGSWPGNKFMKLTQWMTWLKIFSVKHSILFRFSHYVLHVTHFWSLNDMFYRVLIKNLDSIVCVATIFKLGKPVSFLNVEGE